MKKILSLLLLVSLSFALAVGQSKTTVVLNHEILPHPRLLFSQEQEEDVKEQIRTIPLAKELYEKLLSEADILVTTPVQKFEIREKYGDLLMTSREQIYRMITLSMAHRLTKDVRYLNKAESEIINVCNFPNWNPRHFLDVAEMTTAVAIAYDWLYNDLQESTRQLVVESIKSKALDIAVVEYEKGKSGSYLKRETNWNVVCNTGMVMGAMAIAEDNPEMTGSIIRNAAKYMPNCLQHFAPDGTCFEGPAYWGYTNNYLSLFISTLNLNFNQSLGISELEGINKTALYYMDSTSPSGRIFNFANSGGTDLDPNPSFFIFSKQFQQAEVAEFYRGILSEKVKEEKNPRWFFFLALPWFDNATTSAVQQASKLNVYKGINDIGVLKGEAKKKHSIYLIAKGGAPDQAHQQLDIGTFVVETDGVRWSDDLGADDYSLPGFWDGKPNGKRWSYFRNSNLSHNTLAIDGGIQNSAGRGKIVAYEDKIAQPYFTVDMTSAYNEQATSAVRTFTLLNDKTITVTDKVSLLSADKVITWNMITAATKIVCKGNEATLHKDGKKFHLKVLQPQNAVFTTKEAKTFTDIENPLTGYQLLQVNVSGKKEMEIKIVMGESLK